MRDPTPEELRDVIENGPFASELAPYWADVYTPEESGDEPWKIGILKAKAAHEIRRRLRACGERFTQEWWADWPYELVVKAKGKTLDESEPKPAEVVPPPPDYGRYPHEEPFVFEEDDWKRDPIFIKFLPVTGELDRQTDRGAAVLAGVHLEGVLREALKPLLRDRRIKKKDTIHGRLFDAFRPLSTFSGRIDMAYALFLIGDHTHHDLDLIRKIRNAFSHFNERDPPGKQLIRFESDEIAELCDALWFPKNEWDAKYCPRTATNSNLGHPRGKFMYSWFQCWRLIWEVSTPSFPHSRRDWLV